MKKVSYILVVFLSLFVSVKFVDAKPISDDCTKDKSCVVLCNWDQTYTVVKNDGFSREEDGMTTKTEKKHGRLTMYYLEGKKNNIKFKFLEQGGSAQEILYSDTLSGGKYSDVGTYFDGKYSKDDGTPSSSSASMIWEKSPTTKISKDSFTCPKYGYFKSNSVFSSPAICLSDNESYCLTYKTSSGKTIDFANGKKSVSAKITYSRSDPSIGESSSGKEGLDIETDFDVSKGCESYLGNPQYNAKAEVQSPAYYLQFAFNILKYVALIMLFIFTSIEFGKAVVSNNQDAMKKAISNTFKRIAIAVVIFFIPILVEFLFQLLGIYSAKGCGIS